MSPQSAALAVGLLLGGAGALRAQNDPLATVCSGTVPPDCVTAVETARSIQSRVGLALFGGNPVPGTGSTVGLRMAGVPRVSLSARLALLPMALPPLLSPGSGRETALLPALSGQGSVGVFSGFAPAPTVGGVLSLDLLLRGSYAWLPESRGFRDRGAAGWLVGARVGVLRESLRLPGVSLTGTFGHAGRVVFGDPDAGSTAGYVEVPITDLGATLAASRHVAGLDLSAGAAVHRYSGDVAFGYGLSGWSTPVRSAAEARNDRWSGFASAAWAGVITRLTLEAGWQQTSSGAGGEGEWGGSGWWLAGAFRLVI